MGLEEVSSAQSVLPEPEGAGPPELKGSRAAREALAHAPASPGVYLFKDAKGKIIYVGKAKRLKNRLLSYARPQSVQGFYRHKVEAMLARARTLEYVVTGSEKDALLLEHTLIKEHRPRYNVDLRDDKTYPYFRLNLEDDFPRFTLVRRPDLNDGARYFGPFEDAGSARRTMRMLQRIFPLRRCGDHALKTRTRPCLDLETGLCLGPCAGRVSPEEYQVLARQLADFFGGKGGELVGELERRMWEAAEAKRYEAAAILRDRKEALAKTLARQEVARTEGRDTDALALVQDEGGSRLAVLKARGGRVLASRVFEFEPGPEPPEEILTQALIALYHGGAPPPPLVLVNLMPADPSLVAEILSERAGRRVELRKPQRGGAMGLLELALLNASQPRQAGEEERLAAALTRLGRKLGLAAPPETMECVDISHLGGRLTVASLVRFAGGRPDKSGYRHYKVLGLEGPDDYAAMRQVVERRLLRGGEPPDLLVVDGGKGQLAMALAAMADLPPERRPPAAALAKGRAPGEPDRVFVPGRKNPVNLPAGDQGLLLLMKLRDEAHRFAITYHRLLRSKALRRSILDEVPGIGPGKKRNLLKAFGSLAALKRAGAQRMHEEAGLDLATAQRVEAFLASLDTSRKPE
ncbi:MAG: excinuclease ABC subunit UvrC [Deltaproteobacteria bacterium]|nr:excinuclease ABC subunit UvrC [Deltaproteobacteria bacterium]